MKGLLYAVGGGPWGHDLQQLGRQLGDVDVVVVSEALPERLPDRLELLFRDRPPRIEPWGLSADELARLQRRGDPRVAELMAEGVLLRGETVLRELLERGLPRS